MFPIGAILEEICHFQGSGYTRGYKQSITVGICSRTVLCAVLFISMSLHNFLFLLLFTLFQSDTWTPTDGPGAYFSPSIMENPWRHLEKKSYVVKSSEVPHSAENRASESESHSDQIVSSSQCNNNNSVN